MSTLPIGTILALLIFFGLPIYVILGFRVVPAGWLGVIFRAQKAVGGVYDKRGVLQEAVIRNAGPVLIWPGIDRLVKSTLRHISGKRTVGPFNSATGDGVPVQDLVVMYQYTIQIFNPARAILSVRDKDPSEEVVDWMDAIVRGGVSRLTYQQLFSKEGKVQMKDLIESGIHSHDIFSEWGVKVRIEVSDINPSEAIQRAAALEVQTRAERMRIEQLAEAEAFKETRAAQAEADAVKIMAEQLGGVEGYLTARGLDVLQEATKKGDAFQTVVLGGETTESPLMRLAHLAGLKAVAKKKEEDK